MYGFFADECALVGLEREGPASEGDPCASCTLSMSIVAAVAASAAARKTWFSEYAALDVAPFLLMVLCASARRVRPSKDAIMRMMPAWFGTSMVCGPREDRKKGGDPAAAAKVEFTASAQYVRVILCLCARPRLRSHPIHQPTWPSKQTYKTPSRNPRHLDLTAHNHAVCPEKMAQPQAQMAPPPPPALTEEQKALSDAHFNPVSFEFDAATGTFSSPTHDLQLLNALSRSIASLPPQFGVPPPPNIVPPQRSLAVNQAREQGKEAFKRKEYAEAIKLFTLAIDVAASRPLWEAAVIGRDELAVCLANRSAAFAAVEDWVDSYVDADAVVQLKRPWLKGHYRKGMALRKMGRNQEAREAYLLGLQFDPESPVSLRSMQAAISTLRQRERAHSALPPTFVPRARASGSPPSTFRSVRDRSRDAAVRCF